MIEAHATFKHSAHYDDLLHIVTCLRDVPVARVRLDYEVFKDDEKTPLADGYTIHTFVNAKTGKPTRAPAQFLEVVERNMAAKPVRG